MVLKASSVSDWSKVDPDFAELLREVSRNTANVFMGPWSVDIVDVEGPGFRVAFEGSSASEESLPVTDVLPTLRALCEGGSECG